MAKIDPHKMTGSELITLDEAVIYLRQFGLYYHKSTVKRRCEMLGILVQPGGFRTMIHVRVKYLHLWAENKRTINEVRAAMKKFKGNPKYSRKRRNA